MGEKTNNWGETELNPGSGAIQQQAGPMQPVFVHDLKAGLVPPFSSFLLAILAHYQIHLLHLQPASTVVLATFAYLYEAFLAVLPSVAFFRHFYSLRMMAHNEIAGCVSFHLHEREAAQLITMSVTKKVENFCHSWVLVDTRDGRELLRLPVDLLQPDKEKWGSARLPEGALTTPLMDRLASLRESGLMGQMVVAEFLRQGSRHCNSTRGRHGCLAVRWTEFACPPPCLKTSQSTKSPRPSSGR